MNCEKCQEILSDFLDGALSDEDQRVLSVHLNECLPCFNMHADLSSIVSFCRDHRGEYDSPPNEHALWLRIRNTIINESGATVSAVGGPGRAARSASWWTRMMNRSWELSLPQLVTAVAAIAVAVSLGTAFSLRQLQNGAAENSTSVASTSTRSRTSAPGSAVTYTDSAHVRDRLRQQELMIEYLSQRVQQRKLYWSVGMRETFDRNLSVINQAVEDSLQELSKNPHDEISEEMLNAALNDKVELLEEFSDL